MDPDQRARINSDRREAYAEKVPHQKANRAVTAAVNDARRTAALGPDGAGLESGARTEPNAALQRDMSGTDAPMSGADAPTGLSEEELGRRLAAFNATDRFMNVRERFAALGPSKADLFKVVPQAPVRDRLKRQRQGLLKQLRAASALVESLEAEKARKAVKHRTYWARHGARRNAERRLARGEANPNGHV